MEAPHTNLEGDSTTSWLMAFSTTAGVAEAEAGVADGGAVQGPAPSEEEEDMEALPPDHPLLRRAQEALHVQLAAAKLRLEEELRERRKELKNACQKREDVGVELYGFQQHLAKLQLSLERTGDAFGAAASARVQADEDLRAQRAAAEAEEAAHKAATTMVAGLQGELDGLADTLRRAETEQAEAAGRLAVTKRQTYAAEEAAGRAEKAKQAQDYLIDHLQGQLARLGRQLELHTAQAAAQAAETRTAREVLARALADMEGVQYEKRALVGQWKASLVAMAKRDAAMEKLQDELREHREAAAAAQQELAGYARDTAKERQRGEQLASVLQRLEGQAALLEGQVARVGARREELAAAHAEAQVALAASEVAATAAKQEGAKLAAERSALERQAAKLATETADLEAAALERLGEQTSTEQGAAHTLRDVRALRAAVLQKEGALADVQNTVEASRAATEAAVARNAQLAAGLASLDKAVADKAAGVAALEAQMKARAGEIEGKTRELDALNRRLQKLVEGRQGVETGPLEATIANLTREIAAVRAEGRALQHRWMGVQGQLVGVQADNASLAAELGQLRAQAAVMGARQARLHRALEGQQAEGRALAKALAGLHAEMQRLNGQLADATGLRSALGEGAAALEARLGGELRALEAQWAALQSSIEALRADKAEALVALSDVEAGVALWERRVQLEREMQEAIDPAYGSGEAQALRREVARLQHRQAELLRRQEGLVADMERAVQKRELIALRGRAVASSTRAAAASEAQLRKQQQDLERGAAAAEREAAAAAARTEEVRGLVVQAGVQAEASRAAAAELAARGEAERAHVAALAADKFTALVGTAARQREAKLLEEVEAGRYRLRAADPGQLPAEAERLTRRQASIADAVRGLAAEEPAAAPALARVLAHAAAPVPAATAAAE